MHTSTVSSCPRRCTRFRDVSSISLSLSFSLSSFSLAHTHTNARAHTHVSFPPFDTKSHIISWISPNDEPGEDSIAIGTRTNERSETRETDRTRAERRLLRFLLWHRAQGEKREIRPRGVTKRPESAMDSRHLIASVPLPPLLPPSPPSLAPLPSTASRSRSLEASAHGHVSRSRFRCRDRREFQRVSEYVRVRSLSVPIKGNEKPGVNRGNETRGAITRQGARFSAVWVWAPMRNLVSREATLSRRFPPAPTRGRQSLRALVPHCRRSRSNGEARTSGHLYGARDGARSDKRIQASASSSTEPLRGFLPSSSSSFLSLSPSFFLGSGPRDLKVSAQIRHTAESSGPTVEAWFIAGSRTRGVSCRANAPSSRERGQTWRARFGRAF